MDCWVKVPKLGRSILSIVVVCCVASVAAAQSETTQWNENVLYSFQGGTDGALPSGGLIVDKVGNLYGVTSEGGSTACPPGWCGTIYELSPPAQNGGAWTETLLYVFKGHELGDGSSPSGSLIADSAGNMYGTAAYGGSGPCILFGTPTGCGAVFELSPPVKSGDPWTETVLYNFQGGNDGDLPDGSLVFDKAGNLYGATLYGGGQGTTCDIFYGGTCGTVFELSPPKQEGAQWAEAVLHSFAGGTDDGALPNGGLVLDSRGNVYGTTFYGGYDGYDGACPGVEGVGCGTAFSLAAPGKTGQVWTEKLIHMFDGGGDGEHPSTGLAYNAGELYGTTYSGGTVFSLTPPSAESDSWTKTILYSFSGSQGGFDPESPLTFDSEGNIYGTTNVGSGAELQGSVFRLRPRGEAWSIDYLHGFVSIPDGLFPASGLVFGKSDHAYGTTQAGGSSACDCGTVFEVWP